MHYLVCYDIEDDRRRAKAFKMLRGLLRPVQKSVFEGALVGAASTRLLTSLPDLVDLETDSLRTYVLCPRCASRTLMHGTAAAVLAPHKPIIY